MSDAPKQPHKFNDGLPEILSPVYDLVFKLVFANRPDLLKPFLMSAANLPDDDFGEIVFVDPHVYPEHVGEKLGVLDIKVTLKSKTVVDVEMQREKVAHLRERVLYYCAGMVREQAVSGDDYDKINPVVSVTITNHVIIPEDGVCHHRYVLYDTETRSKFTDLLTVHVIELPKLPREDDGSELWWWMRFLTVKTKEELAMIAEKSPVLEKAAARLIEVSEDAHTRHRLESYRLFEMDQRVRIREARAEGMEKGMEKGREEGREEGIEEIIALLEQGYSLDEIKRRMSNRDRP